MSPMTLDTLRRPGGTVLEYWAEGPPDARDLLILHVGTPCAALPDPVVIDAAARRGIRTASYSRPGYAGSTRKPGRTIADEAVNATALADHLGADRFFVVGWSGGGAPALACAALAPERVRACVVVAGLGPPEEIEEDWIAWHPPESRDFWGSLSGPITDELIAGYEGSALEIATVTAEEEVEGPPSEAEAFRRHPEGFEATAAQLRAGVAGGIWGFADDMRAWANPWGFRVADIEVPVTVRHGTADENAPVEHGRWLADHIPGADAQIIDDLAHLSIGYPFAAQH
jgi:pimeloyl-ACP methyl ester carboxylesterase